jgi:predicted transglutaminase-like cysteine proteinase
MSRNALLSALVTSSALSLATPFPALAVDNPFPEIREWAMPQAFIMHRKYGDLDTCAGMEAAYAAGGWPSGVSLDSLQQIDRKLKQRVFLRPDQGPDTWTPLTRTVIAGDRKPAADCDDVAVTGAQLAICAGFPADDVGLMVTQLPSRAGEMHVVAFFVAPDSGTYVFADTMGRPRPIEQLRQKVHFYTYMDDVTKWWALRDPNTGQILTQALPTSSLPTAGDVVDLEEGSCKHLHR